jgi:hypothetical protein
MPKSTPSMFGRGETNLRKPTSLNGPTMRPKKRWPRSRKSLDNAYHYALGLPRWLTEWVMTTLSVLMLGSMHAVQFHHLRHHKHGLDDEDSVTRHF